MGEKADRVNAVERKLRIANAAIERLSKALKSAMEDPKRKPLIDVVIDPDAEYPISKKQEVFAERRR